MGLFISFEGPDGSGKSTQARLLSVALGARGFDRVDTREPGGTPLGEEVRRLLLAPDSPPASALAMVFLLSAARTQLLDDVVRPALHRGAVVVCDRFADSTLAYQSYGAGLDPDMVRTLTSIATSGMLPDVTILIDVPVAVGLERTGRRGSRNRLDEESEAFHERVGQAYRELARHDPDRWMTFDGTLPPEVVHDHIMRALEPALGRVPDPV